MYGRSIVVLRPRSTVQQTVFHPIVLSFRIRTSEGTDDDGDRGCRRRAVPTRRRLPTLSYDRPRFRTLAREVAFLKGARNKARARSAAAPATTTTREQAQRKKAGTEPVNGGGDGGGALQNAQQGEAVSE